MGDNDDEVKHIKTVGRFNKLHRQPVFDPTQCDWLMTSRIRAEEVKCSFPPPESPYEPRQVEGKINFFWEGLDPEKDELVQNARKRPRGANWMCGFCYQWTKTKEELVDHMKNVHEAKARFHVCKTCEKRYPTRFLLQRHEAVHQYEPNLPHSSYVNSHGIPVKEFVENHYLHGVKPANPTAETIRDALATFKKIAQEKPTCVACRQEYEDFGALVAHYDDVHATVYCKLCDDIGKLYPTMSDLKTHLIDVHGLKYLTYFDQGYSKVWQRIKAEERFKETGGSFVNYFHSYAKDPASIPWSKLKNLNVEAFLEESLAPNHSDSTDGESHSASPIGPNSPETPAATIETESLTSSGDVAETLSPELPETEVEEEREEKILREEEPEVITAEEELKSGILTSRTRKTGAPRRACHVCKKLITYAAFQKHIDSHEELQYKCFVDGCNKRFLSKSALNLHSRAHSEDRPFKCDHCPRAYNYGSLLKRHLRTHTGEMPYGCDMCGKRFYELVSLNYHRKKVHTGERPHRCDLCHKAFILAHDLKKHKIAHEKQSLLLPLTETQETVPALPRKKRAGRINNSCRTSASGNRARGDPVTRQVLRLNGEELHYEVEVIEESDDLFEGELVMM